MATITQAPTTVNEGEDIEVEISLDTPFSFALVSERTIKFAVNDADNTLSGTAPTSDRFSSNQTTITITLTAAENTTQNDGAHDVTFALQTNPDSPYTLGDTSSVTIIVRDDDTPPLAVGNLRAQAGNTEATLRWEAPPAPTPDHGQPILHYEYRVKEGAGSFGSWTTILNSDATTTSHVFTGLTNGTEYTYEVRAENVAGDGAEADVSVTPRVGVAVSFGSATASITEGGSAAVTLTLAEAPATGTTVVVPITATRGAGLAATEYSGVPANVTFAAGETSKSFTGGGGGRRAGRTGRRAHAGAGDAAGWLRAGDQRRDRHHGGGRRRGGVGADPDRLGRQRGHAVHRGRGVGHGHGVDHQQRAVQHRPDRDAEVGDL